MKRLFDIVVAAIALLLLAIPLAIIMLILRLTGEGEVWYPQERVGFNGKRFKVLKFATMRRDSEVTGSKDITLRNDSRVMPFGKFLRKTKVNELPQVVNIFIGDMSVVGWRPLMPKSFDYYPKRIQDQIVKMKPGLTGIGSICFRDEESITARANKAPELVYREDIAPYKGELELWYQKHQSFLLDMKLIFLTGWVVLRPGSRLHEKWLKGLPARPASLGD